MIIEQIFVIFARVLFIGAEIIAFIGFGFILYKATLVLMRREKSKRKIAATYLGLAGSFITIFISISGLTLYLEAQDERKLQIEQLVGISDVIDRHIEKSLRNHLSYFQTETIKKNAFDTCEEMSRKSNQEKASDACTKITYAKFTRERNQ